MAENGVTKVRFDLWAVLAFVVILFSSAGIGLYGLLSQGRAERIATNYTVNDRLTKLETNYCHILETLTVLRTNQEKIADAVLRDRGRTKTLKGGE